MILPEGVDFATVTFGDAWDMSEFSDISQYINGAGRGLSLDSPLVQDGLFTATSTPSTTDHDAFFFPLFPGYPGFMQIGNVGSLKPIDSTFYRCFYIAMKVDTTNQWDSMAVYWHPSQVIDAPSPYGTGAIYNIPLYPEWSAAKYWKLFKVDLVNPPTGTQGRAWNAFSPWQGFHVAPTFDDSVPFAVDWIRLTPCHTGAEYSTTITWTPDPAITAVWVRPQGTTRDIRVQNGISGSHGSYSLDTQGLPPGAYQVGLGADTTCCAQWSANTLQINAATVIKYDRPSPTSGEDYATLTGNAWDMETAEDVDQIDCASWAIANGILSLDTPYPAALPAACIGAGVGEADPRIVLNMPGTLLIGHEYRYLSFHMYQNGEYAIPADGMIVRWLWTTTNRCTRVSADLPLEVGWHTYNIDLHDPFNGTPVASAPADNCADYPLKPWWLVGQLITTRFDPNENWTGNLVPAQTFHQEIDWIRLTMVDSVVQGESFPIEITLNKNARSVQYINFYYTTSPYEPVQHFIGQYVPGTSGLNQSTSAPDTTLPRIYLPIIMDKRGTYAALQSNQVRYVWRTASVAAGEYTICAQAFDGYNLTTYCSPAPMQVTAP